MFLNISKNSKKLYLLYATVPLSLSENQRVYITSLREMLSYLHSMVDPPTPKPKVEEEAGAEKSVSVTSPSSKRSRGGLFRSKSRSRMSNSRKQGEGDTEKERKKPVYLDCFSFHGGKWGYHNSSRSMKEQSLQDIKVKGGEGCLGVNLVLVLGTGVGVGFDERKGKVLEWSLTREWRKKEKKGLIGWYDQLLRAYAARYSDREEN